jgi:hypothetical protein
MDNSDHRSLISVKDHLPSARPDSLAARGLRDFKVLIENEGKNSQDGIKANKVIGKPFFEGLDEETYRAAEPHFEAVLKAVRDAGGTLKDLFGVLIMWGGGIKIKPYALRFAWERGLSLTLSQNSERGEVMRCSQPPNEN